MSEDASGKYGKGARAFWNDQPAAQVRGPVCGRFYAPPPPADYRYCYLPKGHEPPCVFTSRQAEASPARTPERKRLFWKQIEQARKDVEAWPDYLKRAFGVKP